MVIRVNKTRDYTVMSNYHLRDKEISLKAKGLLSQMLSLPAEWDYTVEGLCAINKESRSAIESALDELKKVGYLVVKKLMPNQTSSGRIEYEYNIFEQPTEKQGVEKQGVDFLGVEFLGVENHQQLNTDKRSTEKESTEEKVQRRFIKPSVEEVRAYCIERGNGIDAEQFVAHYEANGWKVGKNPMKNWKAAVVYWETNRKKSKKTVDYEAMAEEIARGMI